MPQLDISTFLPQLFWLIISFAFLYIILSQVSLPKLINISQERDLQISEALAAADKNKTEACRLKDEYEKNLANAIQQKNAMIDAALKDISQMIDAKMAEHNQKLKEVAETSRKNLQNFQNNSSKDIECIAAEATQNIISKLFDLKLENDQITKVITEQSEVNRHDV